MKELRVYGPPGTGKTTYLARQIARAAEKFGPGKIMVASYTRAAAAELVGRDLPLPEEAVGTLHAHCFRALGRPNVAEAHYQDFNASFPVWAFNPKGVAAEDALDGDSARPQGNALYQTYNRLRNQLVPRAVWPGNVQAFARDWDRWKEDKFLLDYTDMIERAERDVPEPPGQPAVGFFDEAQDFTPLQLKLVRQWGRHLDWYIVAGDDDQAIYGFVGATPEAFLYPDVPHDQKVFLRQSYRVPRRVQRFAEQLIARVKVREPKEYNPRDVDGEVRRLGAHCRQPDFLLMDASRYLAAGKSVMFLATCGHFLHPLIAELRRIGQPFHNPFRREFAPWNPLKSERGTSTAERLAAYLDPSGPEYEGARFWTPPELATWTEMVDARTALVRGAKGRLAEAARQERGHTRDEVLVLAAKSLRAEEIDAALGLDPRWLKRHLSKAFTQRAEFPLRVAKRHGVDALRRTPQVIVGTIHSVKGGQADVVYVLPDLAPAGYAEYAGRGRDSVLRLMYVAMTRCRESLILCNPVGERAFRG